MPMLPVKLVVQLPRLRAQAGLLDPRYGLRPCLLCTTASCFAPLCGAALLRNSRMDHACAAT
jgi:hypothetical protein